LPVPGGPGSQAPCDPAGCDALGEITGILSGKRLECGAGQPRRTPQQQFTPTVARGRLCCQAIRQHVVCEIQDRRLNDVGATLKNENAEVA
jgi:hypothetical protein